MTQQLRAFALASLIGLNSLSATPVAVPDSFDSVEDQPLTITAGSGVLANDTGTGDLTVTLETDVSNGTLTLNADGSFTYTPDADFNGSDSFTYRAIESPSGPQPFTIVENRSSAAVDAKLTAIGASDSDSEMTDLRGTLAAVVTPGQAPFSMIHITDFDVKTAEAVSFRFDLLPFNLASVTASAEPEGFAIGMAVPGQPAAVNASGEFSQPENEVSMAGTVSVAGTGLAESEVPDGPQEFEGGGEFLDLAGTITQAGGILTLTSPISFVGQFDLAGTKLELEMAGEIVATSP
ncbi:MAG: Ig-like domain-containing protein, partial [Verrucomicrobiales bacterium]